jgi:hypothetical protein
MARKGHSRELLEGEIPRTSGPVPLAGLVRFKTNRNKGNKAWRPLAASDFDPEKDGEEETTASRDHSVEPVIREEQMKQPSVLGLTAFHRPALPRQPSPAEPLPTTRIFNDTQNSDVSPVSTRTGGTDDEIAQVFGRRLPDPIHLQQVTGHEDGEVVFIGHPNRDVSAHQWSTTSFQWINIGQFSAGRRKVEGQLAADRLRGQTVGMSMAHNNLTYFKAIAEQRYTLAKEDAKARPDPLSEGFNDSVAPRAPGEVKTQPALSRRLTLAESDQFGSLSDASTPTPGDGGGVSILNTFAATRGVRIGQAQPPASTMRTVTSNLPEDDPFISTPKTTQEWTIRSKAVSPITPLNRRPSGTARVPEMNYNFEFPPKSEKADSPGMAMDGGARRDFFKKQEQARIVQLQDLWPSNEPPASLREISVGEEAASSLLGIHHTRDLQAAQRMQLRRELESIGNQHVSDLPIGLPGLSALRQFQMLTEQNPVPKPTFDPLSQRRNSQAPPVPPGFENPLPPPPTRPSHPRTTSTLNANAPPYLTHYAPSHVPPRATNLSPIAPSVAPIANLRVSDPDNVQAPQPEIATSGTLVDPIKQDFAGPFFTDTMPTPHAPTTPLAPHLSEEKKLDNWWVDGQRPARQKEYYTSIMSTSHAVRARNATLAPGGPVSKVKDGKTADRLLVPLIENFREYVDEMNNNRDGGRDYFTRAFTTPPQYAVDKSGSGNYTFFGEDCGAVPQRVGRDPRYAPPSDDRRGRAMVRMPSAGEGPSGARGDLTNELAFARFGLGFGRLQTIAFRQRSIHPMNERDFMFGGMGN